MSHAVEFGSMILGRDVDLSTLRQHYFSDGSIGGITLAEVNPAKPWGRFDVDFLDESLVCCVLDMPKPLERFDIHKGVWK